MLKTASFHAAVSGDHEERLGRREEELNSTNALQLLNSDCLLGKRERGLDCSHVESESERTYT